MRSRIDMQTHTRLEVDNTFDGRPVVRFWIVKSVVNLVRPTTVAN